MIQSFSTQWWSCTWAITRLDTHALSPTAEWLTRIYVSQDFRGAHGFSEFEAQWRTLIILYTNHPYGMNGVPNGTIVPRSSHSQQSDDTRLRVDVFRCLGIPGGWWKSGNCTEKQRGYQSTSWWLREGCRRAPGWGPRVSFRTNVSLYRRGWVSLSSEEQRIESSWKSWKYLSSSYLIHLEGGRNS